jgi:hypothetical protein
MPKVMNRPQSILYLSSLALCGAIGTMRQNVWAHPEGFALETIAFLGEPAPGGGAFLDVFESNFINNRGDVLFASNVTANEEQGIFLLRRPGKRITEIARVGEPAPGGGVFGAGIGSPDSLNDEGDVGFMFLLDPLSFPFGINAGVYRYSQPSRLLTAVLTPGVTLAPEGGVFAGATFGTSLNNEGLLAFGGIVPTDNGVHLADEPYLGLGAGVYTADRRGHISTVIGPGDLAPDGGMFDFAVFPRLNASRDVAFMGHLVGEECRPAGFPPQAVLVACLASVYVKDAATGQLRSIAHAGDPAPAGAYTAKP